MYRLPEHTHVVSSSIHPSAEFVDYSTIHRHRTRGYQLLGSAARGHSGMRQVLLQTLAA
jgi:hypothetical protein